MKIYTRTGDKGTTGLFGGKRVSKVDIRIEAVGTIDELNSAIGVSIAQGLMINDKGLKIKQEITIIQQDLFEIGAVLATPARQRVKEKRIHEQFGKHLTKRVGEFEKLIDRLTEKLPPLRSFILPGGSKAGSLLHVARSTSRRAERRIVALSKREQVDGPILIYMNRLSDVIFTMARFVNKQKRVPETTWKGLR